VRFAKRREAGPGVVVRMETRGWAGRWADVYLCGVEDAENQAAIGGGPSTRVRVLCRAMTDARLSFCDVQPGVWLASIEGCLEAVRSRPVLRLTAEDGLHNAGF